MGTKERMCGLCSIICDNFETIEGDMKEVLNVIIPKINLAIQNLVMCTHCTEKLIKSFDFKAECFNTHDYLVPFVKEDNIKLDLRDVYLVKNDNGTGVLEDQVICGLCMDPVENCSAISLEVEEGDAMLKKMIERCLPELDFSIIKKPVICLPCHCSLENCFRFVTKYLTIEDKTEKCGYSLDIDSKLQRDVTISNIDGNTVDKIKVDEQFYEKCGERKMDNEGDIFKLETMICEEGSHVEMGDEKFLVSEELEIKTDEQDFNRFEDGAILPQPKITTRLRRRWKCVMLNIEGDVSKPCIKPTLSNENSTMMTMYQCHCCSFHTKSNRYLKRHLLKCKGRSEVTKYRCDSCSYETQQKGHLNKHLMIHRSPSEVEMYKCDSCSYQTRHKYCLKTHLLVHKGPSEVTMYKCDSCSFQTRYKCNLKNHQLGHKDPSEVTVYKCDSCPYQTIRKCYLKAHLLVHKGPSEVTVYKCDSCLYQTKLKGNLEAHLLGHKGPSEVAGYKCDTCSFQTRHKCNLRRHLLVHKDPSKVTMYKCDSCSFQTIHARSHRRHLLVHKDPSEIKMHKCDFCSFQTKREYSLKAHLLLHKASSEVAMHKCDFCSYQAKLKGNLKKHLLGHMNPSGVTKQKCNLFISGKT